MANKKLAKIRDHLHIRGENSVSASLLIGMVRDHLHIRGENEMAHSGNLLKLGSPPHTWRK